MTPVASSPLQHCNILVTRPDPQGATLSAELQRLGAQTKQLSTLAIEPIEASAQDRQLVEDLDQFKVIIFISANAARFGLQRISDYWPQLPAGIEWLAIGEQTAQAMEPFGINPQLPTSNSTSEALLQLPCLQQLEQQRILLVKGERGRPLLQQTLEQRGANVSSLNCYRRQPCEYQSDYLLRQLQPAPQLIFISSGESLENLVKLADSIDCDLRGSTLVSISPRVTKVAQSFGFNAILTAETANQASMLKSGVDWWQNNNND